MTIVLAMLLFIGVGAISAIHALWVRELELFAAVRQHQFKDITESNYWHRGRLKFPGRIEMECQSLGKDEPATAPR